MSLILEALKKSEAERRLGHVPGLLDQGPLQRRRRGTSTLRWMALLLLVLGVAGAAFWFGQRKALKQEASPAAIAVDAPAAMPEPVLPNPPEQSSASTASATAAVPAATPIKVPPSRLPRDPGFASIERESRAQVATALPPPPVTPPAAAPAASIAAVSPLTASTAATPQATTEPVPAASAESLPHVSSLDPATRGRLPPLKVSMHVFTEEPAGRVVIIDGRRLREGDTVSDGVRLAAIRRDGSVLEIDGRRLLLVRP
jgi:general secretion pathway protein B